MIVFALLGHGHSLVRATDTPESTSSVKAGRFALDNGAQALSIEFEDSQQCGGEYELDRAMLGWVGNEPSWAQLNVSLNSERRWYVYPAEPSNRFWFVNQEEFLVRVRCDDETNPYVVGTTTLTSVEDEPSPLSANVSLSFAADPSPPDDQEASDSFIGTLTWTDEQSCDRYSAWAYRFDDVPGSSYRMLPFESETSSSATFRLEIPETTEFETVSMWCLGHPTLDFVWSRLIGHAKADRPPSVAATPVTLDLSLPMGNILIFAVDVNWTDSSTCTDGYDVVKAFPDRVSSLVTDTTLSGDSDSDYSGNLDSETQSFSTTDTGITDTYPIEVWCGGWNSGRQIGSTIGYPRRIPPEVQLTLSDRPGGQAGWSVLVQWTDVTCQDGFDVAQVGVGSVLTSSQLVSWAHRSFTWETDALTAGGTVGIKVTCGDSDSNSSRVVGEVFVTVPTPAVAGWR